MDVESRARLVDAPGVLVRFVFTRMLFACRAARQFAHHLISHDRVQQRLVKQSGQGFEERPHLAGFPEPRVIDQLVDVPKIVDELAVSSGEVPAEVGEARPSGVAKHSAATAATAVAPTVAKFVGVGGVRPPRIVKLQWAASGGTFQGRAVTRSGGCFRYELIVLTEQCGCFMSGVSFGFVPLFVCIAFVSQ